ncbi:hypothetical protein GCM10027448_20450 [Nocardioides dilutus]
MGAGVPLSVAPSEGNGDGDEDDGDDDDDGDGDDAADPLGSATADAASVSLSGSPTSRPACATMVHTSVEPTATMASQPTTAR